MQTNDTLVQTTYGAVQGTRQGDVCAWLGVPYARSTAGAGRFRAPRPPEPWSGVRDATDFGPACPQRMLGPEKSIGTVRNDDCLNLNVWSRAPDGGKRPVLVWIHGGAFVMGSSRIFTGNHFVAQGDIVVVSINYRLGVLGFVNFGEALGDERIESNLGLRDQVEALRWVRDNIAAFGGDPDRVTIAGESAGSMSVSLLMHTAQAQPLFHGAILQSGALNLIHDREMSVTIGRRYLDKLGVRTLEELQALPYEKLQAAQLEVHKLGTDTLPSAPWFDADLLPPSLEAARNAPTPDVPLLAGFNRDEIRFFELARGMLDFFLSRASMSALAKRQLGEPAAARALAAYPDTKAGNRELGTDMSFGMPTLHFAERHAQRHPTWFYRFDYGNPVIGAVHGIDLLYLWDMPGLVSALVRGGPMWGHRVELTRRMRERWLSFVRHGHPGAGWPAFETTRRATLVFGRQIRVEDDTEHARRIGWSGRDCGPGQAANAV